MKLVAYATALFLFLAIFSWPYGYYILLRWVVFSVSILFAWGYYKSKLTIWTIIFSAIAFLFNPLVPNYLNKSVWVIIDLMSAVLFLLAAQSIKKRRI